jgi:hypothetical protein
MASTGTGLLTDLAGFPMVLALSDDAINEKFAELYGKSTNETEKFPHVPWVLEGDKKGWSLSVERFTAPSIDFDTDTVNGCRLKMKIVSGGFKTYSVKMPEGGGMPTVEEIKISLDGVTLYIVSTVSTIEHEEWSDDYFKAQSLFMDLERVKNVTLDLSLYQDVAIMGSTKAALETVLQKQIEEIGKKNPQALLFGAVKLPRIPDAEKSSGPLKPTQSTYSVSVNRDGGAYQGGALNYLLLDKALNEFKRGNAAGVFDHALVRDGAKGTLVISDASILESFVKPALLAQWGDANLVLERGLFGGKKARLALAGDLAFGVTLDGHDRSATLTRLDVQIMGSVIKVEYTWNSSFYHWDADIHAEMTGYQNISIVEQNGELVQTVVAPEPHIATTDTNLVARVFGDILTAGFDELGRKGTSDSGKESMQAITKNFLGASKSAIDAFILPGGAAWNFMSAKLDTQLFIKLTYK